MGYHNVFKLWRLLGRAKVVCLTAEEAPVTFNFNMVMPSWFDIINTNFLDKKAIDKKSFRESSIRVKEALEVETQEMGDSKKVVIGGFS